MWNRSLDNVERGNSVAPTLRLMQRIIDAQPESPATWGKMSGRRVLGSGGGASIAGMKKDELLVYLEKRKEGGLLHLLVEVP